MWFAGPSHVTSVAEDDRRFEPDCLTTAIFINQLREKSVSCSGSPETTTGGKALKFYKSVRLDIRKIESLKDGTNVVANRTRVKVVKNNR